MNLASIDTRSFEQRFGKTCPFCGKNWSDPGRCGDPDPNFTIQKQLNRLFPARAANCKNCDTPIPAARKYCSDCLIAKQKASNRVSRHRMVTATCERCGAEYERRSHKKEQRYCSLACANQRNTCGRGHPKPPGDCIECRRERYRAKKAQAATATGASQDCAAGREVA